MKTLMRVLAAGAAAAVVATGVALLAPAGPASAAALTEITDFGNNPTHLKMHLYVPDQLAASPGLLVAVHYCTGSGPAFFSGSEFKSLADQYGFVVIYPSATRSGNCFDVSSPGALTHNSTSDPAGILSMVKYVQAKYATDVNRTFVTGASSGGMMTNVLLGDYPDVFAAGSSFMGVPFGCFAATAGDPTDTANQAGWNSTCSAGQLIKTPQEWGDLVRAAYPGYTGRRPRVQLFHGTTDTTLAYPNFGEAIKQWTNVLGVSQTPVATDTPVSGWTRTRYGSNTVQAPVEGISVAGVGHSLPLAGQAKLAISFFGLDSTTTTPTTSPTAVPTKTPTTAPTTSPTTAPTTVPTTAPPSSPPATLVPTTAPPAGLGCTATVSVNQWTGGFVTTVRVSAGSSNALSGWTVGVTLPSGAALSNAWNATAAGSSGAVTFTNVSYNGKVPAGSSVEFGFQGTGAGPSAVPTCSAR